MARPHAAASSNDNGRPSRRDGNTAMHDLFRAAFARRSIERNDNRRLGFAQAGNRFPLFGIMP
jgi:hypothetical protein